MFGFVVFVVYLVIVLCWCLSLSLVVFLRIVYLCIALLVVGVVAC